MYSDLKMPTRLDIRDARACAARRNGWCLSDTYISTRERLKWRCMIGHEWEATLATVRRGCWCPECSGRKRLSLLTAQQLAADRHGKCLSTDYSNAKIPMEWMCDRGHKWRARLSVVRNQGSWCQVCSLAAQALTLDDAVEEATRKGGACLSGSYTNSKTKMKWMCRLGHKWEAVLGAIRRGQWCPTCRNIANGDSFRADNLARANEIAAKRGGKCLSSANFSAHEKVQWRCSEGHVWDSDISHVAGGTWCPNCPRKNEAETRAIFERLTGYPFPETPGLFSQNRRWKLDGYCRELSVAFEYHGIQHYEYTEHFHRNGQEDLEKQQARDREIENQAPFLGEPIALIVIPHWLSDSEREAFVRNELDLLGVLRPEERKSEGLAHAPAQAGAS